MHTPTNRAAQGFGVRPVSMFEKLLPQHLEIIYAINQRHLDMGTDCARVGVGLMGCTRTKGPFCFLHITS